VNASGFTPFELLALTPLVVDNPIELQLFAELMPVFDSDSQGTAVVTLLLWSLLVAVLLPADPVLVINDD